MSANIKVVVVDDSAFMRKAISAMLKKHPEIDVVGIARNGQEGLDLVRKLNPDVVTMDIEMPVMDGLTALRHIMMEMPRPVIMVSSLTTEGAESTLKAMEYGAVDFIPKQLSKVSLDIVKIEGELQAKVKAVARKKARTSRLAALQRPQKVQKQVKTTPAAPTGKLIRDIVVIGVSTGGPPVVQKILSELPENFPGSILIAQHMPGAFTGPFARRLNDSTNLNVMEAKDGEVIKPGWAYIAQGGKHLKIDQKVSRIDLVVSEEPAEALYKPSANVLFSSVANGVGRRAIGVILTGMGSDGLLGARDLKAKGGILLAQSEDTCVVYGMPKAVVDDGLVDQVVDLEAMAGLINASMYEG